MKPKTLILTLVAVSCGLAADTNHTKGSDGRAMPANVVTVAVTPDDALKLEQEASGR